MIQNQDEFITTIQQALGKESPDIDALLTRRPGDADKRLAAWKNRTKSRREQLLKRFTDQAELVNMVVKPLKDPSEAGPAIAELVRNTAPEWGDKKSIMAWSHPLIDSLNLEKLLKPAGVDVYTTRSDKAPDTADRDDFREKLIESYIGITSADFCVAESAALVLRTRPGQPRAVSLVPSIHVAVIRLDQIIENLEELYFRLNWDPEEQEKGLTNCMTFISGPSKTADIELVLVHGAHGPRKLLVYVITG